jgi:hypothetical protein
MILGDKPVLFQEGSIKVRIREDREKTHMKASKNHNNIIGEERLAHIRIIVVSLGGKLTSMFFYATTELHQQRYIVILWSVDFILLFVALVELLGLVDAFFYCL